MGEALPSELTRLLKASAPTAREAAWSTFVASYSRLLLHTARSVAPEHDAAMDGYAHILEQLRGDDYRRLRAYVADGRSKFTTWLVVVARRLCVDHQRGRYGRLREGPDPSAARTEERAARRRLVDLLGGEIDVGRIEAPAAAGPDEQVMARELSASVAAAVAVLDSRDRLLVKLRFDDDLPARVIAEVLGFPTAFHVYRRLNTVLGILRTALRRRGVKDASS
jgi:RNA polymerase sigma factor (sigma-70 family)